MQNINRILVVSRMTASSITAVNYGMSLAKNIGATLSVIHVIHDPFSLSGWNLPLPDLGKDYQKLIESKQKKIDEIISTEVRSGMHIEVLIPEGDPTEEIVKAVKEKHIDLLVMEAHEEGHLEHFLFGRSNQQLLLKMPCSILLVKKEPEACIDKPFCN